MGSCTAGGAYVPAMSDEAVIVKGTGTIFLAGPPLVKAATGEEVTAEELGGGDVHTRISGVADHLAEDDAHALEIARSIVGEPRRRQDASRRPRRSRRSPPTTRRRSTASCRATCASPTTCARSSRAWWTARASRSSRRATATTLVCGFARLSGFLVGIVANNGILFSESALKATHFIQMCARRKIPLLFLQNITGFMVGKEYERGGIAKDGAKMVHAVANAAVPKLTVIIGGSFGAGNYGMCGRAYGPRFLWMWPNARISVMGGPQAASVLSTVKQEQLARAGKPRDEPRRKSPSSSGRPARSTRSEGTPTTRRPASGTTACSIPAETRTALALALSAAYNAPVPETEFGVFRM